MPETSELLALIRSRAPIIVVESREEPRIKELVFQVCYSVKLPAFAWNVLDGLMPLGTPVRPDSSLTLPADLLRHLWNLKLAGVFVLMDFHPYLTEPMNIRLLKQISQTSELYNQTIILLSQEITVPEELKVFTSNLPIQLPDARELRMVVDSAIKKWYTLNPGQTITVNQEAVELLVRNLNGLTASEADRLTRRAMSNKSITLDSIPEVAQAKYEMLNQGGVLTYEHETAQFSEVGGLSNLKQWLQRRQAVFLGTTSVQGIDIPKGILMLGVQGSGKSLAAKAVAGTWRVPLLRLDFGALYDKYFGETERKTRDSLKMAEMMAPCVLWLDEIEKGIATGNDGDSGTSRRLLGTLLTWMAERKSAVFVVATANDIQALPPELMRKGRMDEIFFVDLPDEETRKEILTIHLRKRKLDPAQFDLYHIAQACDGFSGAEIEQCVVAGLYSLIGGGGVLTNEILLNEIGATRPLSVIMSEKINAMREWAKERTVPAN